MTVRCSRRQLLTEVLAAVLALFGVVTSAKAATCGENEACDADPQPVAEPGWEPGATTYTYLGGNVRTASRACLGMAICYVYQPGQAVSGESGVGSVPNRV